MNNPNEFQAPSLGTLEVEPLSTLSSPVSWSAILAGAAAAATLSLVLLLLGTGLGLSSISPWSHAGIGAAALGVSAILWLTLTQLVASGLGGYLAGRLRTRWANTHGDEVFFRDTAHGLLTWAVATFATAALMSTAISSVLTTGAKTGATLAGTVATVAAGSLDTSATPSAPNKDLMAYLLDAAFQPVSAAPGTSALSTTPSAAQSDLDGIAAVGRIFVNTLAAADTLPADDLARAGQIVARHAGLTQAEAEQRVSTAYSNFRTRIQQAEAAAKDAAEQARAAAATTSLWLFISLLIGAFVASYAATQGGRQRDL